MSKNLILYYSRTGENYVNGSIQKLSKGNTAYVATYIQEAIGGDLFPIETVDAYPNDYMACIDQAKKEMNAHARPALVHYIDDISDYDNIFICGPCWWGCSPCQSILNWNDWIL
jgi:flavodoxin